MLDQLQVKIKCCLAGGPHMLTMVMVVMQNFVNWLRKKVLIM